MQKPTTPTRPTQPWTEFRADDAATASDAAREAEAWYDQQHQRPPRKPAAAPLAEAWAFPRATGQEAE
jgi:hypothetical protein